MKRMVGILGGMGPAATVDLFDRIVRATPAQTDQEHLHILIDNNPAIPDRTEAILQQGPDPLPGLRAGIQGLENQGADVIAIPCNTAHHYLPDGIKAGAPAHLPRARLLQAGAVMIGRGAEAIILGCTELPLVLAEGDLPVPLIASNQILAEAVVREAMPAAVPA